MPSAPPQHPSMRYAWGWYYVNIASDDHSQELSIIAGVGTSYADAMLRTMEGRFSDIRIDGNTHIEMRRMTVWDTLFESCNNGKILHFDVERTNWHNITDNFGNASVPLRQIVTLETDEYQIIMDFHSKLDNYNRLLFPFKNSIFSDFEALGVKTDLLIVQKSTGTVLRNVTVNTGGVEFGYNFDIHAPPVPHMTRL